MTPNQPTTSSVLEAAHAGASAARILARSPTSAKNHALLHLRDLLDTHRDQLTAANQGDLDAARKRDLPTALVKRLSFDNAKVDSRRDALRDIAALPDPVGQPVRAWRTDRGLDVRRVRTPLGLILMIYEARPHVTVNAGAFCLKSGNACLLRGGSEVARTNAALADLWTQSLAAADLPPVAIQVVQCSHDEVGELLQMDDLITLVIPRSSKPMVRRIREQSKIPLLKHEDGICHAFVDATAPLAAATRIVVDSKCLLPEVCNALETLLVHESAAATHLPTIAAALQRQGVTLRGCERTRAVLPDVEAATDADWDTEYLGLTLAIRVVPDLATAIAHIERHGSHHTDRIITDSEGSARRFETEVDSAVTLVNASTMFDDGAALGLGAEIGISTDRLHARGPIGLEDLTIPRYVIRGHGDAMGNWDEPHDG